MSRHDQYYQLLRAITTSSPEEQDEIISRLRTRFDPASVLAAINTRSLLRPLRATGNPSFIEREYSNREQAFGLVKGTGQRLMETMDVEQAKASSSASQEPWTTVTQDHDFIEHLLRTYFSWQHVFFQNFPEDLFRIDYTSGNTRYCSRFLVNAICAAGCLLSKRAEARVVPNDPLTAGQSFFDAALKHFRDTPGSNICTVAGLGILANFEASRGRLSAMWNYSGQSGRMGLDLNLHLQTTRATKRANEESVVEQQAENHTFWGCFITDQYVTHCHVGKHSADTYAE